MIIENVDTVYKGYMIRQSIVPEVSPGMLCFQIHTLDGELAQAKGFFMLSRQGAEMVIDNPEKLGLLLSTKAPDPDFISRTDGYKL